MQSRKGLFTLALALGAIWLVLFNLGQTKASTTEQIFASTIYLMSSIPLLIYFGRSEKNIPYMPVFGVFYFVYFGAAIFNSYDSFTLGYISPQIILKCLGMIIVGFISLLIAFYTPMGKIIDTMFKPIKIPWDPRKAYRIGIITGFLGLLVQYFSLVENLPFVIAAFTDFLIGLSRLGIAILFMLQLQNKLKLGGKIALWLGLFIPRLLLDVITGSTFPVILDFSLLFFLYFYYYNSVPWLKVIMVVATFFLIFSVRDVYREMTWFEGDYVSASPLQKMELYCKLIFKRLSGEKEQFKFAYEKLTTRTDYLVTFARVVELTPDYVPYWEGESYKTLLTTFVPRLILPGKPAKIVGQQFGHRYAFLEPEDETTAYNLPLLIEMYVNFGEAGVIIGMFILGLIFRVFYALFNHKDAGEGGLLISVVIFIGLLNIESDFSLIFGSLVQYTILFYLIVRRMLPSPQYPKENV